MYSLKYGTVPIVRATGGLDDSIEPFDVEHGTGTGFKFQEYSGEVLLYAVRQALHHYMDERIWKRIQLNGMAKDYSWSSPAVEYAKLYEAARVARGLVPAAASTGKATPDAGQALRDSGHASRAAGKAAQGSGQASGDSGQAGRNQKPATTSN
jgi:hypothetical protein